MPVPFAYDRAHDGDEQPGGTVGGERRDVDRAVRVARLGVFSVLMLLITGLLLVVSSTPLFRFSPFESDVVNRMVNYQLSALPVAGLALLLTFVFAGRVRLGYLNGNRSGAMGPLLGGSGGGRWETDGWVVGVVMAVVIGGVAFAQLLPGGYAFSWPYVALAVPVAAMNAFSEEAIFRLPYVTMGANDTSSRTYGLVMGSLVFGGIHYWGVVPNGLAGALASAFLGFFLAKSIQETRGFFWAFVIHFMMNITMMLFVLNQAP
jgi:uncharacterized protein